MNPKFKKIRAVTLPVLKLANDEPRYFKIRTAFAQGRAMDDKKEPAHVAEATDLETGEEGLLIAGSVMLSELNNQYPGGTYVNRCFEIVKSPPKTADKKYNLYRITEVAEPEPEPTPEPAVAASGTGADPLAPEPAPIGKGKAKK